MTQVIETIQMIQMIQNGTKWHKWYIWWNCFVIFSSLPTLLLLRWLMLVISHQCSLVGDTHHFHRFSFAVIFFSLLVHGDIRHHLLFLLLPTGNKASHRSLPPRFATVARANVCPPTFMEKNTRRKKCTIREAYVRRQPTGHEKKNNRAVLGIVRHDSTMMRHNKTMTKHWTCGESNGSWIIIQP